MADSVDRVFGHALNTVNKIRPGSQKPPTTDRLLLYGLYKQSMEGDVGRIANRPSASSQSATTSDALRKEQEKWDAWKENQGLSRTEAKRRYIEKLIDTMQKYASQTDEARQLVEELEFVWDQIKNNSQPSGSEHSSPLQNLERSAYIHSESNGDRLANSAAALGNIVNSTQDMRVLSPMSEPEVVEEDREEFVDAPISQMDESDYNAASDAVVGGQDERSDGFRRPDLHRSASGGASTWRRRVESSLMRLTTEIAALREQLENKRFIKQKQQGSFLGWVLRLSWWAVQLIVADLALLWVVLWYLRQRKDRRLEGAIRVLLGDAVAEVRKVASDVRMPHMPKRTHPVELTVNALTHEPFMVPSMTRTHKDGSHVYQCTQEATSTRLLRFGDVCAQSVVRDDAGVQSSADSPSVLRRPVRLLSIVLIVCACMMMIEPSIALIRALRRHLIRRFAPEGSWRPNGT